MIKPAQLIAASLLVSATAHATVTLTFDIASLRNSLGDATDGLTVAIFADNDGDTDLPDSSSLLNQTLSVGSLYGGDELINLGLTEDIGGDSGSYFDTVSALVLDSGLQAGTQLSVYWFDLTGEADKNTIIAGTQYGTYSTTVVGDGDQSFILPADGSNSTIAYYDETISFGAGAGSVAKASDFTADLTITAVPEPSSTALLGLGSVALLLRRRR